MLNSLKINMSCPWAKIEQPEPINFEEIMSEQVASDLQDKEEKKYLNLLGVEKNTKNYETSDASNIPADVLEALSEDQVETDAMIAQLLQMQFDKEYDEGLKREEKHFNRDSKVSISFDNYRRTPLNEGKYLLFVKKNLRVATLRK